MADPLNNEVLRTPEARFAGLPGFPHPPRHHQWDGLRLAHVDDGDGAGPPVLMLHGQPTWSYLFRTMIPPLVAAGHRCVALDLPGFGRSDKPTDLHWYSIERHVAAVTSLLQELDLRDVTLLAHDWGAPLGLRAATGPEGDRIARIVVMDTVLMTGDLDLPEEYFAFRHLVAETADLPVGRLVRMGCRHRPPAAVAAAYDAPFPDPAHQAGPHAFPRLVPTTADAPGAEDGRRMRAALRDDDRPALLLWGEHDLWLRREKLAAPLHAAFPRADPPLVVQDAGHFVPEDQGEHVAALIAAWLSRGAR